MPSRDSEEGAVLSNQFTVTIRHRSLKPEENSNSDDFFEMKSQRSHQQFCEPKSLWRVYNTTQTPHFRAPWAAAVKPVKRLLYRTVESTKLSTSAFATLLTQTEAIINSRPLTAPSTYIKDHLALTPEHLIIADQAQLYPSHPHQRTTLWHNKHWRYIDKMIRQFGKKWSIENLSLLQKRNKLRTENVKTAVEKVVIIKEDNTPPMWSPPARITQTFDGNDIVRVVQLKTQTGVYSRPVSRLISLHL